MLSVLYVYVYLKVEDGMLMFDKATQRHRGMSVKNFLK